MYVAVASLLLTPSLLYVPACNPSMAVLSVSYSPTLPSIFVPACILSHHMSLSFHNSNELINQ